MVKENLNIRAPVMSDLEHKNFQDIEGLKELESFIKVCNLYNWLHFRFPNNFQQIEICTKEKIKAVNIVIDVLSSQNLMKKCVNCGRELSLEFPFTICNGCYNRRYNRKFNFRKKR